MIFYNAQISVETTAKTDVLDITSRIARGVEQSSILSGTAFLFIPGSTASLTTIEFESGVIEDLKEAIRRLAPQGMVYKHDERWGDGNGYSHVRAALLGPSLHIPVLDGRLALGTWQQVVLLDFDNRPRRRRILLQVWGQGADTGPGVSL